MPAEQPQDRKHALRPKKQAAAASRRRVRRHRALGRSVGTGMSCSAYCSPFMLLVASSLQQRAACRRLAAAGHLECPVGNRSTPLPSAPLMPLQNTRGSAGPCQALAAAAAAECNVSRLRRARRGGTHKSAKLGKASGPAHDSGSEPVMGVSEIVLQGWRATMVSTSKGPPGNTGDTQLVWPPPTLCNPPAPSQTALTGTAALGTCPSRPKTPAGCLQPPGSKESGGQQARSEQGKSLQAMRSCG